MVARQGIARVGWLVFIVVAATDATATTSGAIGGPPDPLPPRAIVRLGTDRLRTRGRVSGLAFSPDGRRLLTGLGRGDAIVWDLGVEGAQ